MPVNISIKNAPDELAAALKARAKRNNRSMQREALTILEDAVRPPRRLTPLELLAEVEKLNLKMWSESAELSARGAMNGMEVKVVDASALGATIFKEARREEIARRP